MKKEADNVTRRKFLAGSAAGLAALGMNSLTPVTTFADETVKAKKGEVIFRQLGRSGEKLPIVSMGVMNANNPGLVQAAYEKGMRHFDTAAYYQYGRNEQMVGKVINKLKVRDKVNVGTKVFTSDQRGDMNIKETADKIVSLTEGSLSRLKFDYVDILYVHSVSSPELVKHEGVLEGVRKLKESGKARLVGISTHTNMSDVITEMLNHDVYDVALTSINYTMADDKALLTAIDKAAEKGIGVIAMKTMAGGSRMPNPESREKYSQETIINAGMKWVMRNKSICTSIPGFDNYEHMNQNFDIASDLDYTDDEAKFLKDNNAIASIGFCRQCQKCLATCPNDVNIPKLMRTYMYAAQYANFKHARQTIDEISANNGLANCVSCNTCLAKCSNTVDIKDRIEELKQIYV